MAQGTLVEIEISEGQRFINRLAQAGITITAAAWVKESESGDWYLYLATPLVSEGGGKRSAYRAINDVMREMLREGFEMDPYAKKVVSLHDPIARDMIANRGNRPGGPPKLFRGSQLGNLAVEEAYIYPPMPTTEQVCGNRLWECGRLPLRQGIGQAGICRVVVIDVENETVLQDRRYRGTMANPQPLARDTLEVTWAEGGSLRIVTAESASMAREPWSWSQPRLVWDQGGCPADKVLNAIMTAMS